MINRLRNILEPDEPKGEQEDTLIISQYVIQMTRLEQQIAALSEVVSGLEKQLTRLSKEQFKANTLTEDALTEMKATRTATPDRPGAKALPAVPSNTRLLEALMPVLDSIEAGLQTGQAQCEQIADQTAREILLAWLEGQRLLRERLLALLDKENVRPIQSIGQPFDPYRHVAIETLSDPERPEGIILEERRRGYETDGRVLRFADVVVNQQAREA